MPRIKSTMEAPPTAPRYPDKVFKGLVSHVPSKKGMGWDRVTLTGWVENNLIEVKTDKGRIMLVRLQSLLR